MHVDYLVSTGELSVRQLCSIEHALGLKSRCFLSEVVKRMHCNTEKLNVADIGCGVGNMTYWMAQNYSSSGGVTIGFDNSKDQILMAQERSVIDKMLIRNVRFEKEDICNIGKSSKYKNFFDITYARYVLLHVQDLELAIERMVSITKPRGFIIIEEGDKLGQFLYPKFQQFDIAKNIVCELLYKAGLSPNIQDKLQWLISKHSAVEMFYKCGYTQSTFDVSEIERIVKNDALYLLQSLENSLIKYKLISKKRLKNICDKLLDYSVSIGARFDYGNVLQLAYQKK